MILEMAVINRMRGGWESTWFMKLIPFRNADYLFFIGVLIYLYTSNINLAILLALGFYIGAADGWGKWIGTITDKVNIDYEKEGIGGVITYISSTTEKDFLHRAYVALALRGAQWYILPMLVLHYAGYISILNAVLISFILGAVWVYVCDKAKTLPIYRMPNCAWEWQELINGGIQGLALLLILKVIPHSYPDYISNVDILAIINEGIKLWVY